MIQTKVLFVCIHNSAISQMAEAWLKKLGGDSFVVESAGIEPGTLNPLAVEAMKEVGIDISLNHAKSVFDFFKSGSLFHDGNTVCDESQVERCPIFGGITRRLHWSFADPSALEGPWEEKLAKTREVREEVRKKIRVACLDPPVA
ncbi:MAG: arsenate reductase ArsC [bacterium]